MPHGYDLRPWLQESRFPSPPRDQSPDIKILELLWLSQAGNEKYFPHFFNTGASINARYGKGELAALHCAAISGNCLLMRMILDTKGANINAVDIDHSTPLHHAVLNGYPKAALLLLCNSADVNIEDNFQYTPLHLAMTLVSQSGGDSNTPVAVSAYTKLPQFEFSVARCQAMVEILLEKGAALVFSDSRTALYYAVLSGHIGLVGCVLRRAPPAHTDYRDELGETPLHVAAHRGCADIIRLLVQRGALVNAVSKRGETPLNLAVRAKKTESARVLLELGASLKCSGSVA